MSKCLMSSGQSGAISSSVIMINILSCSRICRADLRSESPTPERSSLDALLGDQFQQLARLYDGHSRSSSTGEVIKAEGSTLNVIDDADGYEFRLFAKPIKPSDLTKAKKIILRSPTPPSREPGFVNARRSDTYYFAGQPSEELRRQYRQAAISGEQLARGLSLKWV